MNWLLQWPVEIVRAKGFLWFATRNDIAVLISQAGPSLGIERAGFWDADSGEKMNELVLIGIGMNQPEITEGLDNCLLTEEELIQDWTSFIDPLPVFLNRNLT